MLGLSAPEGAEEGNMPPGQRALAFHLRPCLPPWRVLAWLQNPAPLALGTLSVREHVQATLPVLLLTKGLCSPAAAGAKSSQRLGSNACGHSGGLCPLRLWMKGHICPPLQLPSQVIRLFRPHPATKRLLSPAPAPSHASSTLARRGGPDSPLMLSSPGPWAPETPLLLLDLLSP